MIGREHPLTVAFRVNRQEKDLIEMMAGCQGKRVATFLRDLVLPRVTTLAQEVAGGEKAVFGAKE